MDTIPGAPGRHFTLLAVAFEISLGIVALILGWLLGTSPLKSVATADPTTLVQSAVVGGLLAIPLFAMFVVADRHPRGVLRDLRRSVHRQVVPLFSRTGTFGLLAISAAAGVGEELLFRGFLQVGISEWLGGPSSNWIAILLAAALFGVCHWLCAAYAVLATMMGIILGIELVATGNLVAPIVTHAAYDFLALLYLLRWAHPSRPVPPATNEA